MVVLILLLLLAAALGILGTVIKVTAVIVLSFVFAIVLLAVIGYYYARHRFRRFVRENQQGQQGSGSASGSPERGYPTTGTKGPADPQLPG